MGVRFRIDAMSIVVGMVKLHKAKPSAIYHSHYTVVSAFIIK